MPEGTRQFRPGPYICDRSPMTVRGGGVPTCFLGFRRKAEWVRRFGASLPMRMTASWFGFFDPPDTRLWRDRSAHKSGLTLIVIPTAASGPACSKLSRCGLATAEHAARLARRPTLTAPAHADVSKARVGTKKRAFRSNKETGEKIKDAPPWRSSLTKKAPYKEIAVGGSAAVWRALWGFGDESLGAELGPERLARWICREAWVRLSV